MRRRIGIGCLVLLAVLAALSGIVLVRSDAKAEAIAGRATASLTDPGLLDHVPDEWIDILVRIEDPSFFDHHGVDLSTPGQGWTTITQGLVKRFFSGPLAGVWGKSRQSVFALALDRHLSKRQQLQVFLEHAYFGSHDGRDLVGFQRASEKLFGKSVLDLDRSEFVGLVAMLVGPNHYDPITRPADHRERVARIEALLGGHCTPASRTDVYLEGCRGHD